MAHRRTTACAGSNFPEIDPVLSRVRATTPHLADCTDFSTVSITLVDTADLPVTSLQSYDFFIELTGSAERSEIRETSEAGTYSFTVIDPRPEKVQVTLTVGDVKLNDAPEIEFLAELKIPSSELSKVNASSPHLADGVDASVVTIELVDRDGNPLSGLQEGDFEIFLVSTMDQDVQAVAGPVSEVQTSGIYTFSITDTIPESFEVFVMVGGVALDDKPEITFEPASQEPEFRPFITTCMTTDGEIIIPTMSRTGSYDYDVYWENLEDESDYGYLPGQSGSARLTGLRNGVPYRVEIRGDFPRIYFNNYPSYRDKILSIDQWGDIEWHSMEAAFYGCSNLEYNASDAPDLSRVTNMRMMFRNATSFNGDIQNWDVGNVTNMYGMFWSADMFNQDLSDWDVSRVVNMELMFNGANSFNGDINGWDVGNVTNMRQMFRAARSFNRELDKWDVRSVTNMSEMFSSATSFNQDLNSWDVSNVKDMDGIFSSSQAFNGNISDWDISGLTSLSSMFHYATSFNGDISGWDVSGITNMYGMFNTATSFNQDLSDWDMSAVKRAGHMFYGASSFDQNLGGWNLTNLERDRKSVV